MAPIDFYFDFVSPYGYFAACQIDALGARYHRRVQWHPILIGVILTKVMGLRPLLETPLKRDYVMHDVPRMANHLGLPFRMPDNGQPNPLNAARATIWALDREPAAGVALAHALLRRQWAENIDISHPDAVVEAGLEIGLTAAELSTAMSDPAVKRRLALGVEAAVAKGVFGSPFVIVDGEPFWGCDRLEMLEAHLGRCQPRLAAIAR